MNKSLKVAILRTQDCEDATLKPSLLGIEGLRICAELTLADDLSESLTLSRPDVLVVVIGLSPVHLLLGRLGETLRGKRHLTVILAGPIRDPDLLLTAMRSGVREFLSLPTQPEAVMEILEKILEDQPAHPRGKLMVFCGAGGGSGTSVVALNVGVEMARSGRGRVVLVDLDLYQGQLPSMLDLHPTYSLLDVCSSDSEEIDSSRLESALLKHESGLRLLARPREIHASDSVMLSRVTAVLHSLLDLYDVVLVDLDRKVDVSGGKIFELADEIVLVGQPVTHSIRNAAQFLGMLVGDSIDLERVKLVLNRLPKKIGSVRPESVEKSLKRNIFATIPDDSEAVSESLNWGVPLSEHATSSKARLAIRDLAMSLLRVEGAEADKKDARKKKSFLSNLFKTNVA